MAVKIKKRILPKLKINKSYLVIAALALGWGLDHFKDNTTVHGYLQQISTAVNQQLNLKNSSGGTVKATQAKAVKKNTEYSGKVVKVSDGDTIHVLDKNGLKHKIRFAGIDAPESKQAYGKDSQLYLSKLIERQNVTVQVIDVDRYGREVAVIWVGRQDINLTMVKAGLAWHYTAYTKHQSKDDYNRYTRAQTSAQNTRQGLWKQRKPLAPWDFRRQQR